MFESFFKKFKTLLKCKVYMIKVHVKTKKIKYL